MKHLITLIIILTSISLFSQVNIEKLERKNGLWLKKGSTKPYNGEFFQLNIKGDTIGIGSFSNGKVHGKRVQFYDNGNKKTDKTYLNGIPTGLAQEFYPSGTLQQSGEFKNGKEVGVWTIYYPTGEKHVEISFVNGVQNGDYIEYSKKGEITERAYYKNGQIAISPLFLKHAKQGDLLADSVMHKEAILQYDTAIAINSKIELVYINRGVSKQNLLDWNGAIQDFSSAISLNSTSAIAFGYRGNSKINIYTSQGIINPTKDQVKSACEDLLKAKMFGDKSELTITLYNQHCK